MHKTPRVYVHRERTSGQVERGPRHRSLPCPRPLPRGCGGWGGWPIPNNITVAPLGWPIRRGIRCSARATPQLRSDSAPMRPTPGKCQVGRPKQRMSAMRGQTCSVFRCGVEASDSRFRRPAKAVAKPAPWIPSRPMANRQCTRAGVLCMRAGVLVCVCVCVHVCVCGVCGGARVCVYVNMCVCICVSV